MTRLVARLVLAMLLLPISAALFAISIAVIAPGSGGPPGVWSLLAVWAILYLFIGTYWVLLWRGVVRWTPARQVNTGLAAAVSLLGGAMLGSVLMGLLSAPLEVGLLFGGGTVPIVWVLATVLIWRETPHERLERLRAVGRDSVGCPVCGYNLTGLRESRCPECGAQFTLDELLAAQTRRDEVLEPEDAP